MNVELEINREIPFLLKNVKGKLGFSLYPKTYTLENFLELCFKPSERRENLGSQRLKAPTVKSISDKPIVDILNIKNQLIESEYPKQLIETILDRNVVTMPPNVKNKPKEEKLKRYLKSYKTELSIQNY